MNTLEYVDVIYGACWGDEGKGKICTRVAKDYDITARFNGGPNAGHTFYIDNQKIVTHVVPTGIAFDKPCIVGPGCVIDRDDLYEELEYLKGLGFDTDLVKISPQAHMIMPEHKDLDGSSYQQSLGTTGKGIGPTYAAKAYRHGIRAESVFPTKMLWDGQLHGKVLCEGAQAVWLDINHGEYPYTTSSECLPYAACSLGFSPKKLRELIAVAKMYDTRAGFDVYFGKPESMSSQQRKVAILGGEFGATTGRPRTVKWLNIPRLKHALEISGATQLYVNKGDILENLGIYRLITDWNGTEVQAFESMDQMKRFVLKSLKSLNIAIKFDFAP